jgi:hypothetical protein
MVRASISPISPPQIDGLRPQGLLARERQQLPGQAAAAIGRPQDGRSAPLNLLAVRTATRRLIVQDLGAQQLGIGADHGQQIVEVVGDTAGQTPDRFHSLRLTQCGLGVLPILDLDVELPIRGGQIAGPFLDLGLDPMGITRAEQQERPQ